jgi:hypothetical protein
LRDKLAKSIQAVIKLNGMSEVKECDEVIEKGSVNQQGLNGSI